jgi:hypothetical protein
MKRTVSIFFLTFLFSLYSCSSSEIITSWKSSGHSDNYKKIMVVGIVKDTGISLRKEMEIHLVNDLKDIGYNAVSALDEFGEGGLEGLEQEQTYVKLCNKGIDAVITIALLDSKKEKYYVPARVKYYSNLYYYNRIWNYNTIQADIALFKGDYEESTRFLWESIFFDLETLSPVYSVQTKTFDPVSLDAMSHEYGRLIIKDMLKKKMLFPAAAKDVPPKAF